MIKHHKIIAAIFIFCFTCIGFRAVNVSIYDNSRARNGILGDGFSDVNVISSAKYFLDNGFSKTYWLPVHDYYPKSDVKPAVYTHYPALPNILAGLYARLFNSVNEPTLRIVPVLLAMLFFFIIYIVLNTILKDQQQALIGSAVLWLGNYFINYADNLHQHLYGEMLKWVFFYVLYQYHTKGSKSNVLLLVLVFIMILEVNISFEQPVFLGILTVGFSIIYQKNIFTKTSILCVLAVAFGFLLHLFQNALYFGNWVDAIDDFVKAYTFRATGSEVEGYVKETDFTFADLWKIPFEWFNRMERFYLLPGWGLLAILLLSIYSLNRKPELKKILIAVFVASISWSLLMAQHAYVHGFTNKHFSIFVGLAAGFSIPEWIKKIKKDFSNGKPVMKLFHIILLLYISVMFLSQQVYEVWLKFSILYPHLGYQ
ncbi:MAG: hypothetical protein ACK4K9_00480 [Bacteroidia bacterium]